MTDNTNSRFLFQRYVQRVAFQVTLSAPMIAALKYVRDDTGWTENLSDSRFSERDNIRSIHSGNCLFVTEMRSLERRGLVIHVPPPVDNPWMEGHRAFQLTRIGEMMCDLLVEAGMMPAKHLNTEKAA